MYSIKAIYSLNIGDCGPTHSVHIGYQNVIVSQFLQLPGLLFAPSGSSRCV